MLPSTPNHNASAFGNRAAASPQPESAASRQPSPETDDIRATPPHARPPADYEPPSAADNQAAAAALTEPAAKTDTESATANGRDLDALYRFLSHAAEADLIGRNTALSLASSCRILFAVLDDQERTDIPAIDLDDVCRRYENTLPDTVSPVTTQTYQRRARQTVADFRRFLDDPANWRPAYPRRQHRTPSTRATAPAATTPVAQAPAETDQQFPVRRDTTIRITGIPIDITQEEMTRMTNFLSSLVIPQTDTAVGTETPSGSA